MDIKEDIAKLLNQALELEHTANIQYLAHAELVDGINAEPIIKQLQEIAGDEAEHAKKFRTLVGDFLGGEPSMGMAKPKRATTIKEILETNLGDEREAVDTYKKILEFINSKKAELPYEFLKLEHEVRHVIMDEQEHIAELKILLGQR